MSTSLDVTRSLSFAIRYFGDDLEECKTKGGRSEEGIVYVGYLEEAIPCWEHMHAKLTDEETSKARTAYELFAPLLVSDQIVCAIVVDKYGNMKELHFNPNVNSEALSKFNSTQDSNELLNRLLQGAKHNENFFDLKLDSKADENVLEFERKLAPDLEVHQKRVQEKRKE